MNGLLTREARDAAYIAYASDKIAYANYGGDTCKLLGAIYKLAYAIVRLRLGEPVRRTFALGGLGLSRPDAGVVVIVNFSTQSK
jgi:hypothetical protein